VRVCELSWKTSNINYVAVHRYMRGSDGREWSESEAARERERQNVPYSRADATVTALGEPRSANNPRLRHISNLMRCFTFTQ
jgi:hypothetical protein